MNRGVQFVTPWKRTLKFLLMKDSIPKEMVVDIFIHVVNSLGSLDDSAAELAEDIAATVRAYQYIQGDLKSLDELGPEFRAKVEKAIKVLKGEVKP